MIVARRRLERLFAVHLEHVVAEALRTLSREVTVRGVLVRDEVHAGEYEQVNDQEVGKEDEPRRLARQYEAGEVERELVVQLQVRVAFLLLAVVELGERVEFVLIVVGVFVEHMRSVLVMLVDTSMGGGHFALRERLQEFDLFIQLDIVRAEIVQLVG